jgi:hypothetical protein
MDDSCFGVLAAVILVTWHGSGNHRRIAPQPCKALLAWHSMLLWIMAVLIPFRSKSEPSSQRHFVRVIEGLSCPACEYEACSTADLHAHVKHKHAPTSSGSDNLRFIPRPGSIVENPQ